MKNCFKSMCEVSLNVEIHFHLKVAIFNNVLKKEASHIDTFN